VPRLGALEVSYKGFLIFSKLKGCYWPNIDLVANKCNMVVEELAQGNDITNLLAGMSPTKRGGYMNSTAKSKTSSLRGASRGVYNP